MLPLLLLSDLGGLRSACRGLCHLLVAELPTEDLAARGLGQLVDELDLAGGLVRGHALLAERDELVGVGVRARLEADEGLDGLAAILVRHADDRGLADRLVA